MPNIFLSNMTNICSALKTDSPTFYPGLVSKFIISVAKCGKYIGDGAKSLFQFLLHVKRKKAFLEIQWWQRLSLSETLCWLSVWRRPINCQKPLYQEPFSTLLLAPPFDSCYVTNCHSSCLTVSIISSQPPKNNPTPNKNLDYVISSAPIMWKKRWRF